VPLLNVITICLKGIRCLDAPKGGEYNKYVIFLYHDGVAASGAFVNFSFALDAANQCFEGGKILDNNREFLMRRLHSLLGIIPIGIFLTQHLIVNHFATQGVEAFNRASHFMANLPFVIFLEIFVIYLPILYHAFYGLYIAFTAKNNPGHYSYLRNILFVAQRYTGVFLVVFIAWHVFETRFQVAIGADEADFNMMANILSNPWMLAFYIVGVLTAVFHLANGLWSFLVTWGITQSEASQRNATYFTLLVFIVLSIIGIRALFAFV